MLLLSHHTVGMSTTPLYAKCSLPIRFPPIPTFYVPVTSTIKGTAMKYAESLVVDCSTNLGFLNYINFNQAYIFKDVLGSLNNLVTVFSKEGLLFVQNRQDTRKFTLAYKGKRVGEYVVNKNRLSFGFDATSANQAFSYFLATKDMLSIDGISMRKDGSREPFTYTVTGKMSDNDCQTLVTILKIIYQLKS